MYKTSKPEHKMADIFADDTFKCVFLYEYIWIWINISVKFVPKGLISNIPALAQDNGMALSRRQAIIWTSDDLAFWCIYASLSLNVRCKQFTKSEP